MGKIVENLKKNSIAYPDETAIVFREEEEDSEYKSITHREFFQYINAFANYLYDEYKGKTIAIIGQNKPEYLVSLFAVIGYTGDALLIDRELHQEDIQNILNKAQPAFVILDDDLTLDIQGFRQMYFSEVRDFMKRSSPTEKEAYPGSLILHTSGTTGTPKFVKLEEKNYYAVIPETNKKWELDHTQSCLFVIPLYHIYALQSIANAIRSGVTIILEYDAKRIGEAFQKTKPALFMGVPLVYNKFRDTMLSKNKLGINAAIFFSNGLRKIGIDIRKKIFKRAHVYFGGNYMWGCSAGSLLSFETNKFFHDIGLPIYNAYGMTETSGSVAINYRMNHHFDCMGKILDCNQVKIIDPDEEGIGEIVVKGENVFSGYLWEDSKECFADGYFKTGDLGYIKEDHLYIVGRKKNILIGANGKNVAPMELIGALLKNKEISDCNVVLENDKLVAIINSPLSEEAVGKIIEKTNAKLPGYKKISSFRLVEKIK